LVLRLVRFPWLGLPLNNYSFIKGAWVGLILGKLEGWVGNLLIRKDFGWILGQFRNSVSLPFPLTLLLNPRPN